MGLHSGNASSSRATSMTEVDVVAALHQMRHESERKIEAERKKPSTIFTLTVKVSDHGYALRRT